MAHRPTTPRGSPPPLDHRTPSLSTRLRALAWRARAPLAALCVALAAAAALAALRPPAPPTVPTVVLAHDVTAGHELTAADLRTVQLPAEMAVRGALREQSAAVGATTALALPTGSPVSPGLLAEALAGPPGTVVAAVRFADAAVGGYLRPGDRVDVLAATPDGGPGGTLATRALVLPARTPATDAPEAGSLLTGGTTPADAGPVLLAVSPAEASALAGATGGALLSAVIVE
ncbi:RcpC/CpaB family pilus assembly protein [Cellulomonas soli]|uniref:RcpC/CpaB family pilus assembly protein n=1 Tax=Cellulomonas soli TaxID=931535 RepID=UPI003F82A50D